MRILIVILILIASYSCKKSSTDTGSIFGDNASVSGEWHGTWESEERNMDGEFDVIIFQDSTELSGTITIDEIGLHNAELKGTIKGRTITFGDIDDEITFKGNVKGDTSASGTYDAYQGQDEGSWNASKDQSSHFVDINILTSFRLPDSVAADAAFDGEFFWLAGICSDKLYKITQTGAIVDSITGPRIVSEFFEHNYGITFVQDQVWVAHNWIAEVRLFALNPDGTTIINFPATSVNGMCFDGENVWCLDHENALFFKMNSNGEILTSFPSPISYYTYHPEGGLAFDGTNLWYCSDYPPDLYKISTTGTLLNSYDFSSLFWHTPGLTYDGQYLWMNVDTSSPVHNELVKLDLSATIIERYNQPDFIDHAMDLAYADNRLYLVEAESGIHQFDLSGTYIGSMEPPSDSPEGLTYDGENLWVSDNGMKKIYKVDPDNRNYFNVDFWNGNYLTSDGDFFWMISSETFTNVCKFDKEGNISHYNFSCEGNISGIVYDGENLWIYAKSTSFDSMSKLYQFDLDGNEIASYPFPPHLPDPYGLAFDGSNLWYVGNAEGSISPYQGVPASSLALYQINIP